MTKLLWFINMKQKNELLFRALLRAQLYFSQIFEPEKQYVPSVSFFSEKKIRKKIHLFFFIMFSLLTKVVGIFSGHELIVFII